MRQIAKTEDLRLCENYMVPILLKVAEGALSNIIVLLDLNILLAMASKTHSLEPSSFQRSSCPVSVDWRALSTRGVAPAKNTFPCRVRDDFICYADASILAVRCRGVERSVTKAIRTTKQTLFIGAVPKLE